MLDVQRRVDVPVNSLGATTWTVPSADIKGHVFDFMAAARAGLGARKPWVDLD